MSAVGHKLWVHMQEKGPYNRSKFADLLSSQFDFPTTHQSISNYLRRPYPPAPFIAASIDALDLSEREKQELYEAYFGSRRRPTGEQERQAQELEEEEDDGVEGGGP